MTRRDEVRNEAYENNLWDTALDGAHEANRLFDAMNQPGIPEEQVQRDIELFNRYSEAVGCVIGPSVLGVDYLREPGVNESETDQTEEIIEPEHQKVFCTASERRLVNITGTVAELTLLKKRMLRQCR